MGGIAQPRAAKISDSYTDLYGDSQWCRPSYEYEKAISEVKERFVAGQLVFQGAWNALEIAGEALFSHGCVFRMMAGTDFS